jgi:hypothetical protein
MCNCAVLQSWNAWFRSRFCRKQREIPAPVLMDTVMGPRAPKRLHSTFRKGVPFNHTTKFFYKMMVLEKPAKYLLKVHKWKQSASLFRKWGTVRCWGGRISHARVSLISMRQALCMINLGFFHEHLMTQPFPKKQLYVLCPLHIGQSVIQVVIKRDRSEGERDFPTGPFSDWHGGASYKGAISYLRLKHLPQIRSRGPGKTP